MKLHLSIAGSEEFDKPEKTFCALEPIDIVDTMMYSAWRSISTGNVIDFDGRKFVVVSSGHKYESNGESNLYIELLEMTEEILDDIRRRQRLAMQEMAARQSGLHLPGRN